MEEINHFEQVYIYGAGGFGVSLKNDLEKIGKYVVGFIDKDKTGIVENIPVLRLGDCDITKTVLIGVCNLHGDLKQIENDLKSYGFKNILSPVQTFIEMSRHGFQREHYWLTTDIELYEKNSSNIREVKRIFFDSESKNIIDKLVSYRTKGVITDLPEVLPITKQYLLDDYDFMPKKLNILDCGAYRGEFIKFAKDLNYEINRYVAFEPDYINFENLISEISNCGISNGVALPLGVSDKFSVVKFDSNGSLGSAASKTGNTLVQTISIDESIHDASINFIKMDIEGMELSALKGAAKTIREYKPVLAISIYHKPQDLWEIPLYIKSIDPEYNFVVRNYGHQCFDTVLYAFHSKENNEIG